MQTVSIGGGLPVVIQTMWKDRLSFSDLEGPSGEKTVERIRRLQAMGCALLRFAVPDLEAAEVLGNLAAMVSMPLVADIHFDYKIALRCLDFPIAKIRINPGNIGGRDRVEKVLSKAAAQGVPIRIGVNAGSLPRDLGLRVDAGELSRAEALVGAAERELGIFDEFGFSNTLVSMKASSVAETIRANRLLAERTDAPLHIGVTEAGPLIAGVTRNAIALHALLSEGLGDTIRVSLSDTMENEVIAGREILNTAVEGSEAARERQGKRGGVTIISCPRCGRNSFDTHGFTQRWLDTFYAMDKTITVAVMGCAVNGPGEGRHADLGITGAGNKALIFRHGEVIRTIDAADADTAFREELDRV
ncbi:4-hydroxy-3-methylbut-2-en-1-yl diphosphate synthase [Treponema primitia ZAS-2]|uniref:4-hydroxy-3-methylbut-2-en-1-yl diphosphate synthase (flavodoxin) n=2 Tax=Treponema primitia TaxID=88058 RepID=F5YR82_TREPZ|nr:4-hydroxy-3-methylbut-2-en-1-yl diphosphate synthase [Treponema primitia ZAS-2]